MVMSRLLFHILWITALVFCSGGSKESVPDDKHGAHEDGDTTILFPESLELSVAEHLTIEEDTQPANIKLVHRETKQAAETEHLQDLSKKGPKNGGDEDAGKSIHSQPAAIDEIDDINNNENEPERSMDEGDLEVFHYEKAKAYSSPDSNDSQKKESFSNIELLRRSDRTQLEDGNAKPHVYIKAVPSHDDLYEMHETHVHHDEEEKRFVSEIVYVGTDSHKHVAHQNKDYPKVVYKLHDEM